MYKIKLRVKKGAFSERFKTWSILDADGKWVCCDTSEENIDQIVSALNAQQTCQEGEITQEQFRFHYSCEWDTDEFLGWDEVWICIEQLFGAKAKQAAARIDQLEGACRAWESAIKHGTALTKDLGTEMLFGEAIEKTKAALGEGVEDA
jgi:hypothetical protein